MNNGLITVYSVHKAFQILDLFLEHDGPLTLGEISRLLGYPKSTVHAILSTMLAHEMVWQREDGRYGFGYRAMEYAFGIRRDWKVAGQADVFLGHIVEETGLSAALFAQASDYFINVSFKTVNVNHNLLPDLGIRMPFHTTASGRLFLSTFSSRKLEATLKAEEFYTRYKDSDVRRKALEDELELIRQTGFSVDFTKEDVEKCCVSVIVPNTEGNTQFAFTAIGRLEDFGMTEEDLNSSYKSIRSRDKIRQVAEVLKNNAEQYGMAFAKE